MGKHGRAKAGRPPYQPTPELARQVMAMTGYGIRQEDIAIVLDIDVKTLYRYYRRELDTGAIEANSRVAQALFKNAVQNENVAAQIFWCKVRMGWKERAVLETETTDPGVLHLLAAQIISEQLQSQLSQPPTVDAEPQPQPTLRNLLDAPPPSE